VQPGVDHRLGGAGGAPDCAGASGCAASQAQVARLMGKARQQIQKWMHRYGIDAERFRR
jgi:hypothetical protein